MRPEEKGLVPVENIFTKLPGFRCFVCSPLNPRGLRLSFYWSEQTQEVFTFLEVEKTLSGFPNVLHGGIQSTILDELGFWAVFVPYKLLSLTVELKIKFSKPVPTDCRLWARAKARRPRHRISRVHASMGPEGEEAFTEAEILAYTPGLEDWKRSFGGMVPAELLPYIPKR